jgi:hypothetical protein
LVLTNTRGSGAVAEYPAPVGTGGRWHLAREEMAGLGDSQLPSSVASFASGSAFDLPREGRASMSGTGAPVGAQATKIHCDCNTFIRGAGGPAAAGCKRGPMPSEGVQMSADASEAWTRAARSGARVGRDSPNSLAHSRHTTHMRRARSSGTGGACPWTQWRTYGFIPPIPIHHSNSFVRSNIGIAAVFPSWHEESGICSASRAAGESALAAMSRAP